MKTATAPRTEVLELEDDIPLLDKVIAETSRKLGKVAKRYSDALQDNALDRLERAMMTAEAIDRLNRAITPQFMAKVMPLMNTRLGFKTDKPNKKDPNPYGEDVVKRCLVEGLLHGVYPFGNEWNIIAGNLYITQEGYQRKVEEIPGLTSFELIPGVPTVHNGQTVVKMAARWKLNGDQYDLRDHQGQPGRVFPIISTEWSSPDATIGKGKRKCLKAVYDQVTGSNWSPPDGEADEAPASAPAVAAPIATPTTRTGTLEQKLAAKNGGSVGAEPGQHPERSGLQHPEDPPTHDDPGYVRLMIMSLLEKADGSEAVTNAVTQADTFASKFGPRWRAGLNDLIAKTWTRIEGSGE